MAEKKETVKKNATKAKTTKAPAKKVVKKAEVKVTPVKEEKPVKECNCKDNTNMLNKIFYCLVVIAAMLGCILVMLIVKPVNTTSNTTNTAQDESTEYDVSMFEELNTTDAIAKIKKGDKVVVYIGRSTCGFCVKFLPTLQKAQKEFGYKTVYIDLTKVSADDQQALAEFGGALRTPDETCQESENAKASEKCGQFGYTPMVVVFEKGKIKDSWVGYSEYDTFATFLKDNGFKK